MSDNLREIYGPGESSVAVAARDARDKAQIAREAAEAAATQTDGDARAVETAREQVVTKAGEAEEARLAAEQSAADAAATAAPLTGAVAVMEGYDGRLGAVEDTLPAVDARTGALEARASEVASLGVGGLTDQFRVVDKAKRGILRVGARHMMSGLLSWVGKSDRSSVIADERGALIQRGATGGATIPGRIGEGSFPGAHLILKAVTGRISAFRIDPVDGALRLIGWNVASTVGDMTAAQLAAMQAEAADYGARVKRRAVALHQPTEQLVLWIIDGQSLAGGWESWPRLSKSQVGPDCFMMGLSVHPSSESAAAWNPVGGSTALNPYTATVRDLSTGLLTDEQVAALTFGDNNRGETPLEGFAAQLRAAWLRSRGKLADPENRWVFAGCGVGGKSIAELSPGASPLLIQRVYDAVTKAKAIATANGWTFSVGGILFNQGEQDYQIGTTYADYLGAEGGTGLKGLISHLRSYVATQTGQTGVLPVYLSQTGGQYARDALELAIGRAQIQAALDMPGVYIVASNGPMPDKSDHLTSNGSRWLGMQIGKAAAATIVEGEGYECTRPIAWRYRGKTLVGIFHAPVSPLQVVPTYVERTASAISTSPSLGIYAADGTGEVGITAVRLDGRLAICTLAREVSGTLKVWLGKQTVTGAVCIADSDTTHLLRPYEYAAGSGQTTDENIAALAGLTYPAANISLADVQTATAV